jgi:hypothetical protein
VLYQRAGSIRSPATPGARLYRVGVNTDFSSGLPPWWRGPLPRLPAKYANPETSPLRLTVPDAADQTLTLDLAK